MNASTLVDIALYLLGLNTSNESACDDGTDPERGSKPVGG